MYGRTHDADGRVMDAPEAVPPADGDTAASRVTPAGVSITYRIRVQGQLAQRWSRWFDGLALADGGDGSTTLTGPIRDQAALHGVLARIRDVGLVLVSVERVERDALSGADAAPGAGALQQAKQED